MRILLTADPELPVPPRLYGGIERVIDSLARKLQERDHDVALLANPQSTCDVAQRYSWPRDSSRGKRNSLRNSTALWNAAWHFKPDVIHSFSRLIYMLPLMLNRRYAKVMSYQRDPSLQTVSGAAKLGGASLVFTGCSEHICRRGRRGGGEWRAIPNFVDIKDYDAVEQVADDAPLVFLSRIERIKGAHTAIEAAKRTGRRLLIAGNRVDKGDGPGYWEQEIAPHLGKDGIEYVGEVDDRQKNELLGQAAAMIVPIEWDEPFGIVFAEALACGTPVISTPRGSLPEIVEQGVHGFLIQDIDEACDAVNKLESIDRNVCRQRAEEYFDVEVVVDQYEELYLTIAQSDPTAVWPHQRKG